MYENIIEFLGKEAGPTSIILVGVHGDEKCGIEALNEILPNFRIQKGRVLIGYGNPKAIENNTRFIESNLNRMFKSDDSLSLKERTSYEYKRAQFLKKYLDQADALLDIHASSTPASQEFIICEKNAKNITKFLFFPIVVYGFDSVEPGGTDYYMNTKGKIGICVECGYSNDPASTKIALEAILTFLKVQGHIEGSIEIYNQTYVHMNELYLTKTNSFRLSKSFNDFENLKAGQLIGIDGNEKVLAQKDGIILFARNRQKIGEEAFLFGTKRGPARKRRA